MKQSKKNAFTLIELVAVLVIMAIIALIATPLVMNIIRKARISADRRSVDAYGRSIELAIAGYLLDTGKFPTSVEQLTIEYSGNQVVCSTTKINSDSSVYLAGCTVAGRSTGDYTYGEEEVITYDVYSVGDEVTYNNVDYRVIKNSSASESTVTLLKATPLTTDEVNTYGGVGTANNHVNMYSASSGDSYYQTAYDNNEYGGMAYYSSVDCGYGQDSNHTKSGCTTDYAQSEVKYVVDAWKAAKAPAATEARLITYEELSELGEIKYNETPSGTYEKIKLQYDWLYNNNYRYWTGSQFNDAASDVWSVGGEGNPKNDYVHNSLDVVRPVITISKSAL